MTIRPCLPAVLIFATLHALGTGCGASVRAQTLDAFSDGDFDQNPAWTGDADRWVVELVEGNPALATNGVAAPDTIYLSVALDPASSRWTFDFAHRGVNLSTFNGARVFVCANGPDVRTRPTGYYVQAGTNNGDAVSLWRVDGDWSTRRELGRSAQALVEGDSSRLHVEVERDTAGRWTVTIDGSQVVEAHDAGYADCHHLALWVKHSTAGRASFVFDNFTAEPASQSAQSPTQVLPEYRDVVINEIQFEPPPAGSEFVELFNRGDKTFQLSTLTLRDAVSSPVRITTESIQLAPNTYAVLVQNGSSFEEQFRTVPYLVVSPWPRLNDSGDDVVLEAGGLLVDAVTYEATNGTQGRSLERIDPDAPSAPYNFGPSVDPFGATPGARNSIFERDVAGPRLTFAREAAEAVLDLFFDEPIRADSTRPEDIASGALKAASVSPLTANALRATFHEPLRVAHVVVDVAVDLRGNRSEQLKAPIAFRPKPMDVVVNEILYEPLVDRRDGLEDQVEFVEILNRSDRRVHLDGLFRTRDPDETGDADTVRVIERHGALDPNTVVVLATEPVPGAGATLITPSLTLRNRGDVIRLQRGDSVLLDEVRYSPSWHSPDLLVRRGVSLERIDPSGSSHDTSNWTSSVDRLGATPGRHNSVRLPLPRSTGTAGLSVEPNPFSPDRDGVDDFARITFVPGLVPARVRLRIFDLSGVMVREVVAAQLTAGPVSFIWDGRDHAGRRLRTGIYIAVVDVFAARNGTADTFKHAVVLARIY